MWCQEGAGDGGPLAGLVCADNTQSHSGRGATLLLMPMSVPSCSLILIPQSNITPQAGAFTDFEELLSDCREEGMALVEAVLAAQVQGGWQQGSLATQVKDTAAHHWSLPAAAAKSSRSASGSAAGTPSHRSPCCHLAVSPNGCAAERGCASRPPGGAG